MSHSVADLVARADQGWFSLESISNGALVVGDHLLQYLHVPKTKNRIAYTWSATYRGLPLYGTTLVVDSAQSMLGQGLVLDAAWAAFDMTDLHKNLLGRTTATLDNPWSGIVFPVPVQAPRPL